MHKLSEGKRENMSKRWQNH